MDGRLRETTAKAHRGSAPRFERMSAGEEWAGREWLADHCEKAGLSVFQSQAVLECATGGNARTFAEKHRCELKKARATIERAAARLQGAVRFQERKNRYWRELLECMKPEKGGEAPQPMVGLLPYVDHDGYPSWGDYLQALRDPRNNRTVTTRARAITEHDLKVSGEALLQEAFS